MFFSIAYPYLFLGNALSLIVRVLTGGVLPLLTIAVYILTALALQTMAKRRGIRYPFLAWIPLARLWLVGSLSDQYRHLTRGQVRNKRVVLVVLKVVTGVCIGALAGCAVWMVAARASAASVMSFLLFLLLTCAAGLTQSVLKLMALYDIYASCEPQNASLYLVLSALFPFLKSIFLYVSRNQELGMPPRKPRQEQEASDAEQEAPNAAEI